MASQQLKIQNLFLLVSVFNFEHESVYLNFPILSLFFLFIPCLFISLFHLPSLPGIFFLFFSFLYFSLTLNMALFSHVLSSFFSFLHYLFFLCFPLPPFYSLFFLFIPLPSVFSVFHVLFFAYSPPPFHSLTSCFPWLDLTPFPVPSSLSHLVYLFSFLFSCSLSISLLFVFTFRLISLYVHFIPLSHVFSIHFIYLPLFIFLFLSFSCTLCSLTVPLPSFAI